MSRLYRDDFGSGLRWMARLYLLLVMLLTAVRVIFCLVFRGGHLDSVKASEIFYAFLTGFRFDTMVACYCLVPPLILLLVLRFLPGENRAISAFRIFLRHYGAAAASLVIFTSLTDLYYYGYFQSHFNILFFGIVDDDTSAVLSGIWNDYPVIRITLGMALVWYLLQRLVTGLTAAGSPFPAMHWSLEVFSLSLFLGIFALGLRGSTGLFPLNYENSVISENSFVNSIAINGVYALKNALSEKRKQTISTDYAQSLKKYHYESASSAIADYLMKPVEGAVEPQLLKAITEEDSLLLHDPPNVIFVQMESFGNYYLDLHNDSLNLLGRLEKQLPDCIVFRNFLSSTSGTIHSLEALLTGSPLTPISQSTFMDCPLSSSVATVYASAGYRTSFITSGALGWRNMDKFTRHQGFDLAEGSEVLLNKVRGAESCDWGVFDGSMYDRALEVLQQNNGKPHFIYLLTTTNHPPFQRPSDYRPFPVKPGPELSAKFKVDRKMAIENFTNYQYANDGLGAFMDSVRRSPMGDRTIIAASGDHNTLQVFNYEDSRLLDKYGVPFIIYIPERYKKFKNPDVKVYGSHKDVFPTLFSLSLSSATYLKTGVNLLDPAEAKDNFAIINYGLCMNRSGVVRFEHDPVYYRWDANRPGINLPVDDGGQGQLDALLRRARAYCASMCYYIQSDLAHCRN